MGNFAALWARAKEAIAGGASSNARMGHPLVVERAEGAYITDSDGRSHVDYVLGMGPSILGHAPPSVLDAVSRSLPLGQTLGATSRLEIELAELVKRLVPCADRVRFMLTGTEAVQVALRLARAFTGRSQIVKFEGHYHGWLDNVLVSLRPDPVAAADAQRPRALPETAGQAPGSLQDIVVLPWNDLAALESMLSEHARDIAGVIMEPVMCNTGVIPPEPGYLAGVRSACDRHGVVLVFDEVITGFRIALGGAQEHFGVTPDMSVHGKAMAGGFPLSCLAGRADIMDQVAADVFHGGTCNACIPTIAAGLATLEALQHDSGATLGHARQIGLSLIQGLRERALRRGIPLLIQGYGTVFNTAFTERNRIHDYRSARGVDEMRAKAFTDAMRERGVRVSSRGNWYVSAAHGETEVARTLEAADAVLARLG